MKTLAALAVVVFTVSQLSAQTPPVAPTPDTKSTEVKPADKPTDAKPADPKAPPATKAPVKKDEKKAPEPKIPGQTIPRGNGTFLGLEVVGGNFKLSFYDKKKKVMAPDVTRATARWPNPRSGAVAGPNRTVLNANGNALVGSKPVLPPFTFNVHLALMQGEGDDAKVAESYDIAFTGK
jgi:hypothetical protein